MKKVCFTLLMITLVILVSCRKDRKDGPGEIYGTWKLTETMSDPGDGSGKYQPVKGDAKYITIEASGTITGEAIPDALTFKVLDSMRLELNLKGNTRPAVFWYNVTSNRLTLKPPCIEGCGWRFIRQYN